MPRARRRGSPAAIAPRYEDNEDSFAELQARIAKTRDYLGQSHAAEFEGAEDEAHPDQVGRVRELNFTGAQLSDPVSRCRTSFFHVTTAYDILRHNGVPLSKPDFLGGGK